MTWPMASICPITDDVHFGPLIKVVTARLHCKFTNFPFVINQFLCGETL